MCLHFQLGHRHCLTRRPRRDEITFNEADYGHSIMRWRVVPIGLKRLAATFSMPVIKSSDDGG